VINVNELINQAGAVGEESPLVIVCCPCYKCYI